jgi:hypothetical protein
MNSAGVCGASRRLLGLLPLLLLACAACAYPVGGTAAVVAIPVLSAAQTVQQSLLNLAEAGVVHYRGSLVNPDGKELDLDASVTATGEAGGTMSIGGQQGALVVVDGALYVDAPAQFWSLLSGDPGSANDTVNSRWVKMPSVAVGIDIGASLRPAGFANYLDQLVDPTTSDRLATEPMTTVGGTRAVAIGINGATVDVAATGTHGVLHVTVPAHLGNATKLSLDVADVSGSEAGVYQDLNQQAQQLRYAVDTSVDIQQGSQAWGPCTAASCAVTVTFTNASSLATKVVVAGDWSGDNQPVGTCQTIAGPVAAGATATASCVDQTAQWTAFYNRAHTTTGDHPYQVAWTAEALAAPPDLGTLAGEATAAGSPATADPSRTRGVAYVYEIDYQDAASHPRVWKYGVTDNAGWHGMAAGQLGACRSVSHTSCTAGLVTSAPNRPSADALVASLVAKSTGPNGCPPGQWVDCATPSHG